MVIQHLQWRGPLENVAYQFVLTSPAVSCMFWSFYLDGFRYERCPFSCCFVGCCFQYLFSTACIILVQFLSSFFFISLQIIELTRPLLGKNCVLFHRLSLTSIWLIAYRLQSKPSLIAHWCQVDGTLLPRYVNFSTSFREAPFSVKMYPF